MKPPFRFQRSFPAWILIACLAGAAHAQTAGEALQPLDHRVHHDVDADGALWARGASYKARFDGAGAMFVPFLGSDAPRNFPVDLRMTDVTVGGAAVAFENAAAPMRDADRIVYDRGTLREVYDLSAYEMEQSFVFDSLPIRGELVVRVQVTSELARAAFADRIEMSNAHGSVTFSRAVAVDAAGVRTTLDMSLDGTDLLIRVPKAAVERAQLPLVVDPVISSGIVTVGIVDTIAADVSYDHTTARTAYVYEEIFSAQDHDVMIQIRNASGVVTFADFVDGTVSDWRNPKVANNGQHDNFMVVADVAAGTTRQIMTRPVSATGTFGLALILSLGQTGSHVLPDIGGDTYPSGPTWYGVVWQREATPLESDIFFALVNPVSGALQGIWVLSNPLLMNERHPSIAKSTGDGSNLPQGWGIAWDRQIGNGDRSIMGALVDWNGGLVHAPFMIASTTFDEAWPTVSSHLPRVGSVDSWMVAWQRDSGSDHDIIGAVLQGNTVVTSMNLSSTGQFTLHEDQIAASVDSDGRQFVLSFMETVGNDTSNYDLYVSQFAFVGNALWPTEDRVVLGSVIGMNESWPQVAAERSSGAAGNCVNITWLRDSAASLGNIYQARYCGRTGGSVTAICFDGQSGVSCPCGTPATGHGCPSSVNPAGALLSSTGDAAVTADSFVLQGSGMPATSSCLYFQGTTPSLPSVFGDGLRCTAGSVIRLASKTNVGGASQYPSGTEPSIHVRGQIPAAGGLRAYQVWYRNAADFCGPSTFNVTNALMVVWVP